MKITQEKIDDIDEMIEDDMTFEQIAASLGLPEPQSLSVLMTVGVEHWKPKIILYLTEKQNRLLENQGKILDNQAKLEAKQEQIDAKFTSSTRITTTDVKKRLGIEQS